MNIVDAWKAAEKTCYTQMLSHTNTKDGVDAFRGWIPEDRDCWMFTTGGLAAGTMDRHWGDTPLFCNFAFGGRVVARYADRDDCMELAGKIFKMLNDTQNMKNKGNVQYLRLDNLPTEPLPVDLESGMQIFLMEIPMQMIFTTTAEN